MDVQTTREARHRDVRRNTRRLGVELDAEVKMSAHTDVVDDLFAPVLPSVWTWWLKRSRAALLKRYYAKMDAKARVSAQIKELVAELNEIERRIKSHS